MEEQKEREGWRSGGGRDGGRGEEGMESGRMEIGRMDRWSDGCSDGGSAW